MNDPPKEKEERKREDDVAFWPAHDLENDSLPASDAQRIKVVKRRVRANEGGHLEFFSEESTDGFEKDKPSWVAFCPDCGAKLSREDHEECPYFAGEEFDEEGRVVAVRCVLPKED